MEVYSSDAVLLTATCTGFCIVLLEFPSMSVCIISFSSSSNARLPPSTLNEIGANSRNNQWENWEVQNWYILQDIKLLDRTAQGTKQL